jgi:hypothetical protein
MEVCYWALLFMPLVILHHLLNVFVQLANKRGEKKKFVPHRKHNTSPFCSQELWPLDHRRGTVGSNRAFNF